MHDRDGEVQFSDYPGPSGRRDSVRVPDYGKYCPVSMGSEVLADRWTPLIVRELVLGSTRFNDIARGLPGISRSLLVQRLGHLERCGVLERWPSPHGKGHEYRLTPAGRDLQGVLEALGHWAVAWLYRDADPHDVDASTLMWWMHYRVDPERLPVERVVVQFDHTAPCRQSVWLLFEAAGVSVCLHDPGFDVDVVVTCRTPVLADVFSGVRTWRASVDAGDLRVEGPPRLARELPQWFTWSPFAAAVRAAHTGSV